MPTSDRDKPYQTYGDGDADQPPTSTPSVPDAPRPESHTESNHQND